MADPVKTGKRGYRAPRRAAAAAVTKQAILEAAKACFEERGWAGTTIRAVAARSDVSPKTIEALFGTKAALLAATVDYAIRGDAGEAPILERESARSVESAPDAATMLERHAAHAVSIVARSAHIARVVESAAGGDEAVAALWRRMLHNRRSGARWAGETLLRKPGRPSDLTLDEAEQAFLVAIDWGTYRLLTEELGLAEQQARAWLEGYYRRMLLR